MGTTDSKASIRAAVLEMCCKPLDENSPSWERVWVFSTPEVGSVFALKLGCGTLAHAVVCE